MPDFWAKKSATSAAKASFRRFNQVSILGCGTELIDQD
jgi:hypothetical protein